jgi:probable HAF family extracellular repeat protein
VASEAIAINSRGDVVGWSFVSGSNAQHPVLWRDGRIANLGTLGGRNASPTAINARGDVVGWSETATGEIHAFFWSDGVMTDLAPNDPTSFANGINAAGDVAGTITRGGRILGVIWERR